jgi:hypothetical protein
MWPRLDQSVFMAWGSGAAAGTAAFTRWIARLAADDPTFTALYARSSLPSPAAVQWLALAAALGRNRTLTTLHLSGLVVPPDAAAAIASAVARHPALVSLAIGDAAWGDAGASLFLDALASSASSAAEAVGALTQLDLQLKALTAAAVPAVARAATAARLHTLALARNSLGDAGLSALAVGLAACGTLRTLDVAACDAGPAGVAALAAVLPRLGVTELALADNSIGTAGAAALAAALSGGAPLRSLGLANTALGDDGGVGAALLLFLPRAHVCPASLM